MIMKKLTIIVLALLLVSSAFSQINIGIKAGASTTTVPTYNISGTDNIEALKNADWGFQAGVFLRLAIKGIYLQPEVVFASNSYDYNVTIASASEILKTQSFNRLEIPVLLGLKLGPVRVNAGPSATVQIGSPKALIDDPDFADMYRGATFGYQAGVGMDLFKKLTLDARYGGSLSGKFGDAVTIGGQTFKLDSRQPSFILSVGLMF